MIDIQNYYFQKKYTFTPVFSWPYATSIIAFSSFHRDSTVGLFPLDRATATRFQSTMECVDFLVCAYAAPQLSTWEDPVFILSSPLVTRNSIGSKDLIYYSKLKKTCVISAPTSIVLIAVSLALLLITITWNRINHIRHKNYSSRVFFNTYK